MERSDNESTMEAIVGLQDIQACASDTIDAKIQALQAIEAALQQVQTQDIGAAKLQPPFHATVPLPPPQPQPQPGSQPQQAHQQQSRQSPQQESSAPPKLHQTLQQQTSYLLSTKRSTSHRDDSDDNEEDEEDEEEVGVSEGDTSNDHFGASSACITDETLKRDQSDVRRNEYCILIQVYRHLMKAPKEWRRSLGEGPRNQLAAITGVGIRTAQRAIHFSRTSRIDEIIAKNTNRGRRPKVLNDNYATQIMEVVKRYETEGKTISAGRIREALKSDYGIEVLPQTLRRDMIRIGLRWDKGQPAPKTTHTWKVKKRPKVNPKPVEPLHVEVTEMDIVSRFQMEEPRQSSTGGIQYLPMSDTGQGRVLMIPTVEVPPNVPQQY